MANDHALCKQFLYWGNLQRFQLHIGSQSVQKNLHFFPLRKAIECLGDECLEVRQPHDLGVLPLVQDVVDANLADVEDAVVVGITARRQLPRISLAQALGKQNLV